MVASAQKMARSFAALGDATRIAVDAWVLGSEREWEYPDMVLNDEERDALRARAFSRTLADIDELPEA